MAKKNGVTLRGFKAVEQAVDNLFDNFKEDLEFVGEITAEAIVRSTLSGIGENGRMFKPYSKRYLAYLRRMGGKSRGTVDLRGLRKGSQAGLVDTKSEMSQDLIKIAATDHTLTLTYKPRSKPYMLYHQEGQGHMPKRKWFTLTKSSVKKPMLHVLRQAIAARIELVRRQIATMREQ